MKKILLHYITGFLLMLLTLSTLTTVAGASARMRVAVLPFQVQANLEIPDAGEALANLIVNSLDKLDKFDLVERGQLNKILAEQKIGATGLIDEKTALQIGNLTGANQIITGNLSKWGKNITIICKLINAQNATIIQTAKVTANSEEDIPNKMDVLVDKLVNGEAQPVLDPLYSWVNQATGNTYLSTNSEGEGIAAQGFVSRGIIGYISKTESPGTIPLYKFRHKNNGDYLYTARITYGDKVFEALTKDLNYEYQKIVGFVALERKNNTTPLYRFQNIKQKYHFYTTDLNDPINKSIEFTTEGQEGFVWKTSAL